MSELRFIFAEISLQLMIREVRKKVQSSIRLISNGTFDELPWRAKDTGDCRRFLDDTEMTTYLKRDSQKRIVRTGSWSSVSGAVLYRKNVLTVLRRRMATGSSQDVFFSSQDAWKGTELVAGTLHGQTQTKMHGTVMASCSSDLGLNSETRQLARSFVGSIQSVL